MMSGNEVKRVQVPKAEGDGKVKLDAFGRPKERKNVVGVVAWRRDGGRSGHWAAAGTDGAVTVFGPGAGIGD
jgi:mitogen-activated protein kinase organizer 1